MSRPSRLDLFWRPLLVSLLVGAVVVSLTDLLGRILPGWDGRYLVAFCMLTALEAAATYHLIDRSLLRISGAWRVRAIEGVLLFLLLQIAANLAEGRANPLAGIPRFDGPIAFGMGLVALSWLAATATARDFDRLGEPVERSREYVSPFELLASRFFAGAAVLVLAAGLALVDPRQLLNPSRAAVPGPLLNVLAYFLLGMVLLGQVQYAVLRERWREQRLAVAPNLGGRWLRYSLAFLALVVLLAAILPTSYTVGLLDLLRAALGVVLYVLYILGLAIVFPFAWLLSLIRGDAGDATAPAFEPPPLPAPPPAAAGGDWAGLSRSLLFWIVVGIILVYLVRVYLVQHPAVLRGLRRFRLFRLLASLWAALRGRARRYAAAIAARRPRRAPRQAAPGLRRPFRLGTTTPREQVISYYLRLLHRADRQGFPRERRQTPAEYQSALVPRLPEVADDLAGLTGAFVEARYSRHEVTPDEAGRARAAWRRLQTALRALRRQQDGAAEPPPLADPASQDDR